MLNSAVLRNFHSNVAGIPVPRRSVVHPEHPRMDYESKTSKDILKRLSLYKGTLRRTDRHPNLVTTGMRVMDQGGALSMPERTTYLLRDIQAERDNVIINSVIEEASSMMLKSIQRQASRVNYESWVAKRADIDRALGITVSAMAKSFNEVLNTCHIGAGGATSAAMRRAAYSGDTKYQTTVVLRIIRDSVAYFSGSYSTLNQDPGIGLIDSFIEALSEWSSQGQNLSPNFLDGLGFIRVLYTQKSSRFSTPMGRYIASLCYLNDKCRKMIQSTISGTGAAYLEWRERPNIQFVARFLSQVNGPKQSAVATRISATGTSTDALNVYADNAPTVYSIAFMLLLAGFYTDLGHILDIKNSEFSPFPVLRESMLRLAAAVGKTVSDGVPLDTDVHFYLRTSTSNLMHEYERVAIEIINNPDCNGVLKLYRVFLIRTIGSDTDEDDTLFENLFCRVLSSILSEPPQEKDAMVSTMMSTAATSNRSLLMSKNPGSKMATGEMAYTSLILMDFRSYLSLLTRSHQSQVEPFVAFVCLRILESRHRDLLRGVFVDISAYYRVNLDEQKQHLRYTVDNIATLVETTSVRNIISADGKVCSIALLLSTLQYYLALSGEVIITESHLSIARILRDEDQVVMLGLVLRESLSSHKFVHNWLNSGVKKSLVPLFYLIGALTAEYHGDSQLTVAQLYHAGEFFDLAAHAHVKYMLSRLAPGYAISQADYKQAQELKEGILLQLPLGELHQIVTFADYLFQSKVQLLGYKNMNEAIASFSQSGVLHIQLDVLPQLVRDFMTQIMQYSYQLLREVRLVGQQDIREPAAALANIANQCGRAVDNSVLVDILSLRSL